MGMDVVNSFWEDFEQVPSLELPFKHSRVAGEHFLQKFSRGDAFPKRPYGSRGARIVRAHTLHAGR